MYLRNIISLTQIALPLPVAYIFFKADSGEMGYGIQSERRQPLVTGPVYCTIPQKYDDLKAFPSHYRNDGNFQFAVAKVTMRRRFISIIGSICRYVYYLKKILKDQ